MPDFIQLLEPSDRSAITWTVVEMKTSIDKVEGIRLQLQSGADQIRSNSAFHIDPSPRRLLPIVVYSKGGRSADFELLKTPRRGLEFGVRKKIPVVVGRSPFTLVISKG